MKKFWKGASGRSVTIYGQGQGYRGRAAAGEMVVGNSCDVSFGSGKSYLVYAYNKDHKGSNVLRTDICTATKLAADAEKDLLTLGSPKGSLPDTGGHDVSVLRAPTTLAAAFALLVLVGALILRSTERSD